MNRLKVHEVMTGEVTSVRTDTPFKSVVWTLAARGVSGAPVLDMDGLVVGVVSEADLLPKESREIRGGPRLLSWRKRRALARKTAGRVAGELMNSPAITVGADTPLPQAAALLARHSVKRLPVVDPAGRLIGILSRKDVLRAFLRADREIAHEIEQDVLVRAMSIAPGAVSVLVRDGVVVLRGQVERKSMVAVTAALAGRVDGVVAVVNEMTFAMDDTDLRPTEPTNVGILHDLHRPR